MTNLRKSGIIAAILGLALALPTGALAASTSSTVNESASAVRAVAMTVPASVTYTVTNKVASGPIAITAIDTSFTTGVTNLTVMPNNGGGGLFDYTKRALGVTGTGFSTYTPVLVGGWSSASSKTIASKASGDISGGTVTVASSIDLSTATAGNYTGTLAFTLSDGN